MKSNSESFPTTVEQVDTMGKFIKLKATSFDL